MGVLIAFEPGGAKKRAARAQDAFAPRGEILFFTGVRYERQTQIEQTPQEPPRHQGGTTGKGRRRKRA